MKQLLIHLLLLFCLIQNTALAQMPNDIKVLKIWDNADHNAFTDLIRFNGEFYCSFREGSGHVPGEEDIDGTVRILRSSDGENWENAVLLAKEGIDLRDPKLSVTPDGRLMVIIGGSIYQKTELQGRIPHVSFSDGSGMNFSDPQEVKIDPKIVSWGDWIWRVTWHKGVGYGMDYQIGPKERRGPTAMYLVKTTDGINYKKVSKIELDGFPNEATIRFDQKDRIHVLIRRELGDQLGVFAMSKVPYKKWDFEKLDVRLGGPNFIFTEDQKRIMGTRVHEPEVHTGIFTEEASGKFKEVIKFPSAGDNSYPGLVIYKDDLWVSFYSSHEGKSSIYISRIPMGTLEKL